MDPSREPGSLTEAKAAQLLDRAAKLDAEGGPCISVDELREVAIEAGISAESFERALAEITADRSGVTGALTTVDSIGAPPGKETAPRSLLAAVLKRAGVFLTGSALALLFQFMIYGLGMDSEAVMVFTLVLAGLMVVWSAVTRRRNREVLDFEVDLGVLWTAITFWVMVMNPGDVGDVLEVMMPSGFLASLLGGLVVATGPAEREPEQLPERV